jgi:hypothetical protein
MHELSSAFVAIRCLSSDALEFAASHLDELEEKLGLAGEMNVERAGRHAGRACDVDDRCVVIPDFSEDLLGRVEELNLRAFRLSGAC